LTPGALSAIKPILPSKKEVGICAQFTKTNMLGDLSMSQKFFVDIASIAGGRVVQRVEALIFRSEF